MSTLANQIAVGPGAAAEGADFGGDLLGVVGGARDADDVGAGVGELEGDGAADAAAGAGDHGDLVGESAHVR